MTPSKPDRSRAVCRRATGAALAGLVMGGGCTTSADPASRAGTTAPSSTSAPSSASATSTSAPQRTAGSPSTTTPSTTTSPTTTTPAPTCAERTAQRLTERQRIGQLLMVGLQASASSRGLARQVASQHLGGVIYLGGWEGADAVSAASRRLQSAATAKTTGGVRLLIAADQEGGQVQRLKGPGFSRMPSARTQATLGAPALQAAVTSWSKEVANAGVNVNLAPVADTVPTSIGADNDPIGRLRRDFNPGDAQANGRDVVAFVKGSLAAGVAPAVKHFPGLGRVTGNTDLTAAGTTDGTTSATDSYLEPFAAGVGAGAPLVMISSARYPRIDADNLAMFSPAVISDLLRDRLGFDGVVITDDVGAARAVAHVPVGERASRFIAAGGDIVLTAQPAQARTMIAAVSARMAKDATFARQVEASVLRVLDLKVRLGLVPCGS